MALKDKYKELIDAATSAGVSDLKVREQDNVLYIDGSTPDGKVKDNLWNIYNKIDPDFRAGDLILNIDASAAVGTKAKVTTQSSNLNIRKGPGTDQQIVGKAAHNEIVKKGMFIRSISRKHNINVANMRRVRNVRIQNGERK